MKNILITSSGRRVSLVRFFKSEAEKIDKGIKIFTADMNPYLSAACNVSDRSFKVGSSIENDYIDQLLAICKQNNIGLVIPTIDTELPLLAANRNLFAREGVSVIISSPDFVSACCDKRKTFDIFSTHGIRCPKLIDINNPEFPIFAKPSDGSSSKGIHIIKSEDDLSESIKHDTKLIFMEYIDKNEYCEFTVDMYYGRDNRVKCIVPRERLEIRGGETSKGITRKNFLVDFVKQRFEYLPGVIGCVCVQLFYRESDNDVVGIEINPRFGGGYPLSFHAGADFPRMLIEEYYLDKEIQYYDDWQDNLLMLRYDAEVIIKTDL